jgi:sugar O-acyltransferase (sialic acid O-acetyltransferase NeuD family)
MLLYGAGGHSKVIIEAILSQNDTVTGIFDDNITTLDWGNYNFLGKYNSMLFPQIPCIISIGNNTMRKKIDEKLSHSLGKVIHSRAYISPTAEIEEGTMILPFVCVQAYSKIGKNVILNTHSTIEHDCKIENYVHIAPNACLGGEVEIGEGTLIGMGANILPQTKIGKWCVIGAGAVVRENIPDYSWAVGVPAKIKNWAEKK